MNPVHIPEELIGLIKEGKVIGYIGAGLSQGAGLEGWGGLLRKFAEYCSRDVQDTIANLGEKSFLSMARYIEQRLDQGKKVKAIDEIFYGRRNVMPTEAHMELFNLPLKGIVTTNFDQLLEIAYTLKFKRMPRVLTWKNDSEMNFIMQNHCKDFFILKSHGSIENQDSLIFSTDKYVQLAGYRPYQRFISYLKQSYSFLFVGNSFSPLDDLYALLGQLKQDGQYLTKSFALINKDALDITQIEELEKFFNISVISYNPTDKSHPEVRIFLANLYAATKIERGFYLNPKVLERIPLMSEYSLPHTIFQRAKTGISSFPFAEILKTRRYLVEAKPYRQDDGWHSSLYLAYQFIRDNLRENGNLFTLARLWSMRRHTRNFTNLDIDNQNDKNDLLTSGLFVEEIMDPYETSIKPIDQAISPFLDALALTQEENVANSALLKDILLAARSPGRTIDNLSSKELLGFLTLLYSTLLFRIQNKAENISVLLDSIIQVDPSIAMEIYLFHQPQKRNRILDGTLIDRYLKFISVHGNELSLTFAFNREKHEILTQSLQISPNYTEGKELMSLRDLEVFTTIWCSCTIPKNLRFEAQEVKDKLLTSDMYNALLAIGTELKRDTVTLSTGGTISTKAVNINQLSVLFQNIGRYSRISDDLVHCHWLSAHLLAFLVGGRLPKYNEIKEAFRQPSIQQEWMLSLRDENRHLRATSRREWLIHPSEVHGNSFKMGNVNSLDIQLPLQSVIVTFDESAVANQRWRIGDVSDMPAKPDSSNLATFRVVFS